MARDTRVTQRNLELAVVRPALSLSCHLLLWHGAQLWTSSQAFQLLDRFHNALLPQRRNALDRILRHRLSCYA